MSSINFKYIVFTLFFIIFLGIFATQFVSGDGKGDNDEINNYANNNTNNLTISGESYNYTPYQEFWKGVYEQNASDWNYQEWRHYIIVQTYDTNESELADEIKNDSLFENNIHILTLYVWGMYNGSLSQTDIDNLKNQLIHNTVEIDRITVSRHDDVELTMNVYISVKSTPSMIYVADRLRIYLNFA